MILSTKYEQYCGKVSSVSDFNIVIIVYGEDIGTCPCALAARRIQKNTNHKRIASFVGCQHRHGPLSLRQLCHPLLYRTSYRNVVSGWRPAPAPEFVFKGMGQRVKLNPPRESILSTVLQGPTDWSIRSKL